MPIRCRCSACEAQFRVDDKYAGKRARCPKCSQVVNVPQSDSSEDVAIFPTVDSPNAQEARTFPSVDAPRPAPPRKPAVSAASAPTAPDPLTKTVDLPAGFPLIDTSSESPTLTPAQKPTTASAARAASSVDRRKKKSPLPIVLGAGGVGIVAVIVVILAVANSGGNNEKAEKAADESKPNTTALVYEWPVDQRRNASLTINGKKKSLPTRGPVEFSLGPGTHSVLIERRGYEPIKESLTLKKGETRKLRPEWVAVLGASTLTESTGNGKTSATPLMSLPGYEGWWQNLDKAKEVASQEKKDLLIAFVGSDWNRESQILRQEVFASLQFKTIAERYVRVVIDSPKTEAGYNQLADAAANRWVKQDYGVVDSRIPLVVLADQGGRPYVVQDGYDDDGGRNYLSRLSTLHEEKTVRDALFANVDGATGEAKLDAALKASEWISKNYVASFFDDEIKQWLTLAEQFDPNNAKGKYEAVFELQWMSRLIQAKIEDDGRAMLSIVTELKNWVKNRKIRDPNRGARMFLLVGMTSSQSPAELQKHLDDALAYNPTDAELKQGLNSLKEFANRAASRVLGSGSGFVVGDAGYIMTNFHVIEDGGKPYAVLPGFEDGVLAEVVARDTEHDLALLKIDVPEGLSLKPLQVSTKELGRGFDVAAFGFPLGGESLKATFGRISGLPSPSSEGMYVLDCTINPGNSGGPLCDKRGTVVGIVTAKTLNSQAGIDSYGMAVPAGDIEKFLAKHLPEYRMAEEERPSLQGWDQVDPLVSPSVMMIQIKGG